MSHIIHQLAFYLHVTVGGFALIIFWLPMIAKKGSPNHVKYGRYFANGMYAVAISGFIMTTLVLIDPIGVREPLRNLSVETANQMAFQNRLFSSFLFMLSLLVFNSVHLSLRSLAAKADRNLLKTPGLVGGFVFQLLCALIVGAVGTIYNQVLFQIFAGLCIANGIGNLRYIFKTSIKPREWLIVHLGSILGAGIGAYTAFFVFGGSRLFSLFVSSNGQVVLWVIPGVVGTIGSIYLSKKYKAKYKVA